MAILPRQMLLDNPIVTSVCSLAILPRQMLLDNPIVTSVCSLAILPRHMKIYLKAPSPILANRMWPCFLHFNSTYAIYIGFPFLLSSLLDLGFALFQCIPVDPSI